MTERKRRERALLLALSLIAITAATYVVRPHGPVRVWFDARKAEKERQGRVVDQWSAIAEGARLDVGDAEAKMVIFTNYECPYCRLGDRAVADLMDEISGLGVVIRPFGVASYPQSSAAAIAALCAGEQGRFAAMHRRLFASTEWRISGDFVSEAEAAGVPDLAEFASCLVRDDVAERARANLSLARQLGVAGTPGYVFPSGVVRAGLSPEEIRKELGL